MKKKKQDGKGLEFVLQLHQSEYFSHTQQSCTKNEMVQNAEAEQDSVIKV